MAGLERLHFSFTGTTDLPPFAPVLAGVVGSGNLEVLLEPTSGSDCRFVVVTSARGFADVWEAVLNDFHDAHSYAGVVISIHDMGATPAVVRLRLDQAASMLRRSAS